MTNQPTSDVQQFPDNETLATRPIAASQPAQVNYWMISTLVLGAILIVSGIIAFKYNTNQAPVAVQEVTPVASQSPATSPAVVQKELFSNILKAHCKDNKINLQDLPFTLSQSIKNAYSIDQSIKCSTYGENYIELYAPKEPTYENSIAVYIYHKDSVYMGMENSLESLSKYRSVTINGQTLSIRIREPGPYGISTLGLLVSLIAEKTDQQSGTIVRVQNDLHLEDEYFVNLIKKYGQKTEDPNSPIYVITDPGKKSQFIEEIVSIAGTHELFKAQAQKVKTYLDGVSF